MGNQKTCLLTGGAGFIGSNLSESLINDGYRVIVIDNLITGKVENLKNISGNPNFKFINSDVIKPVGNNLGKIDYVFHLASPASVPDYQKYPQETALVNSIGTKHLLDLANTNHAKFLFFSTSEIYGNPLVHPQTESYWGNVNPVGVRSCYDESKRFGEMMTMIYYRTYGLNVSIIRIFNTYGPRMRPDDGRVVSNFINQAIAGKPITIYGDGSQTRSFCFITDLVEGIKKVMFERHKNGEIYNLGNPQECTVNDLAKLVIALSGSKSPIVFQPLPADDPQRRKPDITKVKSELDWEPVISIEAGLESTIYYYRSLI